MSAEDDRVRAYTAEIRRGEERERKRKRRDKGRKAARERKTEGIERARTRRREVSPKWTKVETLARHYAAETPPSR